MSPLDHPATGTVAHALGPRLPAPTANVPFESIGVHELIDLGKVVPSVEAQALTDRARRTDLSGVQRSLDQLAVVPIRRGRDDGEWDPSPIGQEAALHTALPAVSRVRTGSLPTEGSFRERAVHRLPGPVHTGLGIVDEEGGAPELSEDSGVDPFLEAIVDGALGAKAPREGTPLNAGTEEKDDPGQAPTIVSSGPSTPN